MRFLALLSAAVLLAAAASSTTALHRPVRYDGQRLVRFRGAAVASVAAAARAMNLDVWGTTAAHVDVRLTDAQLRQLTSRANGRVDVQVLQPNVQATIDQEEAIITAQEADEDGVEEASDDPEAWFKAYHRYDDMKRYVSGLADRFPRLAKYTPSIGKSVEGRDIFQLEITSPKGDRSTKPVLYLQAQQHAREWIAGKTSLYIATQLLSKYGADARLTALLDKMVFVIVPMCNPDGFEYTWTKDRLWRKNRALIQGKPFGVDLNRNWQEHWGGEGSSPNPASQTYAGPHPESEPEVRALVANFKKLRNVIAAIDMHSYSELLLRPWGFTQKENRDYDNFAALSEAVKNAIKSVAGTEYVPQRGMQLYAVNGGSRDWFYGNSTALGEKKRYSMTIELSPSQDDPQNIGFVLPPERIIPVGRELSQGIWTFAEYVYDHQLGVKTEADLQA